jgi:imidazolonepropionase
MTCKDNRREGRLYQYSPWKNMQRLKLINANGSSICIKDQNIEWIGAAGSEPSEFKEGCLSVDCKGKIVIPGLIDCHTHLAFAGWRADEFCMKTQGASYQEIAARGGGIMSTVRKTREASLPELAARAEGFLKEMCALGVTTVEVKSGYGLTLKDELKILRAYRELQGKTALELIPTFLGAHTIPPEYERQREKYVALVIEEMIPAVAEEKLAVFCDVFVEEMAFTVSEAEKILLAAQKHGLRSKVHADQLKRSGGTELAAKLNAVSADHLEYASGVDFKKLADSGCVAVLLPFASLYLKKQYADGRKMKDCGVTVAVATDFNPGSAPSYHLPAALLLACLGSGLTPSEALSAATSGAAKAVAAEGRLGEIRVGAQADLAIIEAESIDQWIYHLTANRCMTTIKKGKIIFSKEDN